MRLVVAFEPEVSVVGSHAAVNTRQDREKSELNPNYPPASSGTGGAMFTYTGKGKFVFRKHVMRQEAGDGVPHQHTIRSSHRDEFLKASLITISRANCRSLGIKNTNKYSEKENDCLYMSEVWFEFKSCVKLKDSSYERGNFRVHNKIK